MSTASSGTGPQGEIGAQIEGRSPISDGRIPGGGPVSGGGHAPGDSTAELAGQIAAFAGTFERWANRKAIEAGASEPRLRLLYAVHCHGPQKMADLADALTVTPRNVTALVDGLEADGLVRRVPHSTDRRVTLVELTANAERVESQFAAYQASIIGLFADFDEADRQSLARLLGAISNRMRVEAGCTTDSEGRTDA
jgi:DNA-binding MarR family transcriptional regulator